jgi:Protein of unknown function (DUF1549)/Protein of unknown function (DUF1553)
MPRRIVLIVLLLTTLRAQSTAAEPLHVQIDRLIAAKTPNYDKLAAPIAGDAEFVRRIYLDLTGMIPTAKQVRDFLADKAKDKRTNLIDKLLATPEYARHMQRRFDVVLMRRLRGRNVPDAAWEAFLRKSFADNKPYDRLVREILSNDGRNPKDRGPAKFYLDRNGNVNELTKDIGRVFLGADLECAQCHNHPEIDDYKQADYYGISAFLVRSYVFRDRKKRNMVLAEKAVGEVSFESVFDIRDKKSKGPRSTTPKVFGIAGPDEPKLKKGQEYKVKPTKRTAGVPKFSRRDLLPKLITSPQNDRFPRTAANRLWAMFLGRGLVHPVDRDHSGNPPSHPELLQLLTREFRAHKYDVKWFVRELLLSQTYQRSSRIAFSRDSKSSERSASSANRGRAPLRKASESRLNGASENALPDSAFGQAILRPLTPEQFAWSVLQATGEADVHRASLGKKLTEDLLHKRLASYETRFVTLFGGRPGEPPQDFESTVDQVLFLSNDALIAGLLKPKPGNLTARLLKLPADKPQQIAEELFLSALSRKPTKQDVADVTAYLKNQTGPKRTKAMQELVWATVCSAEFRFVH